MRLTKQWDGIEQRLPEGWGSAGLRLTVRREDTAPRAAAILAPLTPGRQGTKALVFQVGRGTAVGPDRLRRALRQLEDEHISAMLQLVTLREAEEAPPEVEHPPLAEAWAALIADLPEDWSDVYGEFEVLSTDDLDRAALLTAPINPARRKDAPAYRFRSARRFGYGASAGMVERCLARLDEAGVRGDVRILRVLADTKPVATQGPVWYLGGRAV